MKTCFNQNFSKSANGQFLQKASATATSDVSNTNREIAKFNQKTLFSAIYSGVQNAAAPSLLELLELLTPGAKITLMLPSQKIKLLMENRETFLNQNKLAHLPLPHTRSPPENFTTKFMAQRGAMVECPSLLWLTTVRILTSSTQKTIKINTPLDRVECWFNKN